MSRHWFLRCLLLVLLCASPSLAAVVQRFALVIGNNRGNGEDIALHYAETDAQRLSRTLRELGGFEPADMVLLQGESAETTRRTLISLNDRIRSAQSIPGTETLLFVYYSGHADGQSLHLGGSNLPFRELAQLVRGSAATFRLLVIDACRSGTLTRSKGGRIVAPFGVGESGLSGEGLAFLTASAENEDAQESDEIKGSFFTHALVSGLLGAADRNLDGAVALEEVYAYARDVTIRATSKTFAGTQHPMFRYEVKGQGALILTRPARDRAHRGWVTFPRGVSFLVLAGDERGAVVGEVGASDMSRGLSLAPGNYFVRGRTNEFLLEGAIRVEAGRESQLDAAKLNRVEYARLVRKGSAERRFSHGPFSGMFARAGLNAGVADCLGPSAGYRFEFASVSLSQRFDYCASSYKNSALVEHADEFTLSLAATHAWDFHRVSAFAGVGLGANLMRQSFESRGLAPTRWSLSPMGFALVGAQVWLAQRFYLGSDVRLEESLMKYQSTAFDEPSQRAMASGRISLAFGLEF